MKNTNFINTNNKMFKNLSKKVTIGCLSMASCLIGSVAYAGNPNSNWTINNSVTDCYEDVNGSHYAQASTACQSYSDDLYENWNPGDGGASTTDIKILSVGADSEYFYFEIDLREEWDDEESRQYYLEMVSANNTSSGYFLVYKPKSSDLGSSWRNKGNSGEVEVYTGGPSGYNNDLSSGKNLNSGDFYVRLVNGNVQLALKKSKLGSPSSILTRAYSSQNSTLENSKVHWNRNNSTSDLSGFGGFDNTAGSDISTWLSSDPPSTVGSTPPGTTTGTNPPGTTTATTPPIFPAD